MTRTLRPTLAFLALIGSAGCHHKKHPSTPDGGSTDMAMSTTTDGGGTPDGSGTCGVLPAVGPMQVVPPSGTGDEIGSQVQMALDRLGRPIIAYLDHPDGQTQTLYVLRWDDCLGTWRAGQKIDDTIDAASSRAVSISVDPKDGRIGIAYQKSVQIAQPPLQNPTEAAYFAVSTDDGATFTPMRISKHKTETDHTSEGDADNVSQVTATLANGNSYVAWVQEATACGNSCAAAAVLSTSTAGGAFTQQLMTDTSDPDHGGYFVARSFPLGLAVDSAGTPALVAHREPPTAYDTLLGFWHPGDTTFAQIDDSNNVQNDDGAAALVFDGLKPRVVSRLQQGSLGGVSDYDLVFSYSNDGSSWLTSAIATSTHVSVSESIMAHSGVITIAAGGPHIIRTSDLMTFSDTDASLAQSSEHVSGVLDTSGKLWMAFEGVTPAADSTGGVVLYREP